MFRKRYIDRYIAVFVVSTKHIKGHIQVKITLIYCESKAAMNLTEVKMTRIQMAVREVSNKCLGAFVIQESGAYIYYYKFKVSGFHLNF